MILAVALVMLSGTASAQENPAPTGGSMGRRGAIEIGLRVAYAVPSGTLNGGTAAHHYPIELTDEVKGMIPVEIDAGYRTTHFYVGLSYRYGFAFVNTSTNPASGAEDLRLGVNAQVHLAPGHPFDPWLGFGVGYEWLSSDASGPLTNAAYYPPASGLELANFQLGGDIAVARHLAVGPFIGVSLGQYSNVGQHEVNEQQHQWLEFGLRGAFDATLDGLTWGRVGHLLFDR